MPQCHLVSCELSFETYDDFTSLLQFYAESGVDFCINDEPTNWVSLSLEKEDIKPRLKLQTQTIAPPLVATQEAQETALNISSLENLKIALRNFNASPLKKTAKHFIFAEGNPTSQIMFIGDTPKGNDDAEGVGYSGAYGQLMDNMLKSIGLSRKTAYLTQIIPYRPPGNRPPTPQELNAFLPFMLKHIELISPKLIVILGGLATSSLLNSTENLVKLRGKIQIFNDIQSIPTFHPDYLLKHPLQKRLAYVDLLEIKKFIF